MLIHGLLFTTQIIVHCYFVSFWYIASYTFKVMKKVILSTTLLLGFCVYGFASNKIEIDQTQQTQTEKTVKAKPQKYNFSLFKFIRTTPTLKKQATDSTKSKEEVRKLQPQFKGETTDISYEKPFSFFKLS